MKKSLSVLTLEKSPLEFLIKNKAIEEGINKLLRLSVQASSIAKYCPNLSQSFYSLKINRYSRFGNVKSPRQLCSSSLGRSY